MHRADKPSLRASPGPRDPSLQGLRENTLMMKGLSAEMLWVHHEAAAQTENSAVLQVSAKFWSILLHTHNKKTKPRIKPSIPSCRVFDEYEY